MTLYIGGVRVDCAPLGFEGSQSHWNDEDDRAAAELGAKLAMTRLPGPIAELDAADLAADGWIPLVRGYARPVPAPPEALTPLTEAHHAAMRGLYGLCAGAFPGMLAREDPGEWAARLEALPNLMGIIEGDRLMLWLSGRDGNLLELSAAPDALNRIPGALAAAGIVWAPAPLLGVPAEWVDESVWLRLLRPFSIPGARIETARQLARALSGAVQWD